MEVHRRLGHGFLEAVYQEAVAIEFTHRTIVFEREISIPIRYRDRLLACTYRADFLCFGSIIVELKALAQIGNIEKAQLLNYLKATSLNRGLLLNFGGPSLQHQRMVWTPLSQSAKSADHSPDETA